MIAASHQNSAKAKEAPTRRHLQSQNRSSNNGVVLDLFMMTVMYTTFVSTQRNILLSLLEYILLAYRSSTLVYQLCHTRRGPNALMMTFSRQRHA
jgi:hypothetical protein